MIRVIIAEDHAIVRAGVRALLENAGDVKILGEAADGQQSLQLAEKLLPDVVVMDIMMPRLNGIQAAEKMREMKLPSRVVLLSMYSDEPLVYQALQSGVKGYVLKSSVTEELLWAVRAAARGETYLSGPISEIMVNNLLNPHGAGQSGDVLSNLSPREKEILKLIAEEHTSIEIAEMLFISEKTVEKHRSSLMEKLHVRNVAGLVRAALRFGLIGQE
jgi:DNA-binding NarL/FixJ family response regulator